MFRYEVLSCFIDSRIICFGQREDGLTACKLNQGCLWSEIHICLKALLLCLLGNGGRIAMHCFTPDTSAWEVPHWFSVLSLWGGLQCALEMRDFPWAAGGTRLENAGAAGGKCPVQKQRGAKRKKASRQQALREAVAESASTLPLAARSPEELDKSPSACV